jgi:hypothetical protein
MDVTSLATTAVAMQQGLMNQQMTLAGIKQDNKAQQALVQMVTQATQAPQAAAANGVGQLVDISA